MKEPLGMDPKVWKKRNSVALKEYGKNRSWKKGYKAGKRGKSAEENPYSLTEDIITLLRKRTYWFLGFEEARYTPSKKQLKAMKESNRRKEKKHKHKKHGR